MVLMNLVTSKLSTQAAFPLPDRLLSKRPLTTSCAHPSTTFPPTFVHNVAVARQCHTRHDSHSCAATSGSHLSSQADTSKNSSELVDPFATMEVYHDNLFDRFMIKYFSRRMSANLGGIPFKDGFQGFVDLSKEMMRGRNSHQQQQTVAGVLSSLLPPNAPDTFQRLFPFNRWTAEMNALITKTMFAWLVGPMEVQTIEVQHEGKAQQWKSGVHIRKCRYMEQTACAGICTNLCKLPTQDFFTNTFGLPLTMNPNFEDLSCEMQFGVPPPPVEQDAVYGQPCYKICEIAQEGRSRACHRLDTERAKKGLSDAAVPASVVSTPK